MQTYAFKCLINVSHDENENNYISEQYDMVLTMKTLLTKCFLPSNNEDDVLMVEECFIANDIPKCILRVNLLTEMILATNEFVVNKITKEDREIEGLDYIYV